MAVTNGYCSLDELKTELGVTDGSKDSKLEIAIAAASRQIDGHCGRRFWQDGSVVTREFFADDSFCIRVPEGISTTTGLIVKVDDGDDGTFATTLTLTTNYILLPLNAADEVPAWPYDEIRVVDSDVTSLPRWSSGRPGVQVTAKFGWPAVPDDVKKATLIQATQLFKASDAAFGAVQLGVDAISTRVRGALNPIAEYLLERYVRHE